MVGRKAGGTWAAVLKESSTMAAIVPSSIVNRCGLLVTIVLIIVLLLSQITPILALTFY
jgi:hypothetical protein